MFIILIVGVLTLFLAVLTLNRVDLSAVPSPPLEFWAVRSIDTVKYSRDPAREALNDTGYMNDVVDRQISEIAATGATHVAIGTPYDAEFLPVLREWVRSARGHGLHVWFRGNFSGWEGWFGYPRIGREEHMAMTRAFIEANSDLFEDGDIFTSCPECENGGPGDPRRTGDVIGHRRFLIDEYNLTSAEFAKLGKQVISNYLSMNGDEARLIMDKPTTAALGGVVTVDHYVSDPDDLVNDIRSLAAQSGGRIVLGEFGTPIPDINGRQTDKEQDAWIGDAMSKLSRIPELIGVNYWTAVGGSTAIWDDSGNPKPAVETLESYYKPQAVYGTLRDELGRPIAGANIDNGYVSAVSDPSGYFSILDRQRDSFSLVVTKPGLEDSVISPPMAFRGPVNLVLQYKDESLLFKLMRSTQEFLRGMHIQLAYDSSLSMR